MTDIPSNGPRRLHIPGVAPSVPDASITPAPNEVQPVKKITSAVQSVRKMTPDEEKSPLMLQIESVLSAPANWSKVESENGDKFSISLDGETVHEIKSVFIKLLIKAEISDPSTKVKAEEDSVFLELNRDDFIKLQNSLQNELEKNTPLGRQ